MSSRLVFLFLLLALHCSSNAQTLSIGAGVIYGDDIKSAGVHLRGYYNLPNEKVCFGPEYSYFLETSETKNGEEISLQLSEVNFNAHYLIEVSENWGIYPLGGANLSFETETVKHSGVLMTHTHSFWGINLGAGIHRPIGRWVLFSEYDHLFSNPSQNSFLLGAFFTFSKEHKEQGIKE